MKVRIVFDDERYLYHLVDEVALSLECEFIYSPQEEGELCVFRYKNKQFSVNPRFSGFVGLAELND